MEIANYTLRLEPKSPETVSLQRVRTELQQRGFQEMETSTAQSFSFVLDTPAYALHARLETDADRQYVQSAIVSLDLGRLPATAVATAAADLSSLVCRLADTEGMAQMVIHHEPETGERLHNGPEGDNSCDLCNQIEQHIRQRKQPLKRFPAVSAEEAHKWMDDFPQRRERFVAAVREGKN